jgi:hypothetical protein
MFSHVWSSAGYKQWKTTLIFIKGLLEDEQGLSMGEMLTVNFRQPSHEFTFNLHWFIILTTGTNPRISQVHSCMSILEFIVHLENLR